jgi:Flp pilus assembly protein TadG
MIRWTKITAATPTFGEFYREDHGSVAVIAAALASVLVVGVGVSVDLARAYSAKSTLQSAVDAAALAVGANSPNATSVTAQMQAIATDFVKANASQGGTVSVGTPAVSISGQSVVVSDTAQVPTTFLQVAGVSTVTVGASGTALRSVSGLEAVLVLDNTGSLSYVGSTGQSNFKQLQTAANQLTAALFGGTTVNNPLLRVGVVPYTGAVNPYTTGSGTINVASSMISGSPKTSSSWSGCVVERYSTFSPVAPSYSGASSVYTAVAKDLDSTAASAGYLLQYLNPVVDFNSSSGCPTAVLPLTNTMAPVTSTIAAMNDNGGSGTVGSVGIAWGYRMLSPNGPFAIDGAETVNPWTMPKWKKVVVLMTDGVNEETNAYNGFGEVSGNRPGKSGCSSTEKNYNSGSCESGTNYDINNDGITLIDAQEEAVCDALRANGVTIFSVFLNSNSTPGPAISYCAGTQPGNGTKSGYFYAATNENLIATFTSIGDQLTNLRLTQ